MSGCRRIGRWCLLVVASALAFGCAYDAMLTWMDEQKDTL
jgi:hypothetical protein